MGGHSEIAGLPDTPALKRWEELRPLLFVEDEPTATVWQHIEATQPNYPGTEIPRSFVVETDYGHFWTHGNATKHMYEAVISTADDPMLKNTNPSLFAQFILYDYRKELTSVVSGPLRLGVPIRTRHWEFIFSIKKGDKYPVIKHAVFTGL